MPRLNSMSWDKGRGNRWRKWYKGVLHVVTCEELGAPESRERSCSAANAWWGRKKAEIDLDVPPHPMQPVLDELGRRKAWADGQGDRELSESIAGQIREAARQEEPDSWDDVQYLGGTPEARWIWQDRLGNAPAVQGGRTVGEHAGKFLEGRRARNRAGLLSASQVSLDELALGAFTSWLGPSTPIDRIDAAKWEAWFLHVLASEISPSYKKRRWWTSRMFVSWLVELGLIVAPPNLMSKRFNFGSDLGEVEVMTVDEVRRLVSEAPGQLKLHLLLMLNCGMTQIDIRSLKPSEVDWERGRITRKRTKTKRIKAVPTVCYKLWPETLRLLREFGHRDGDHALLTESGRPWVRDGIKADGKRSKTDAIKSNFVHLARRLKIETPMKLLRKTSATLLANSPEFGHLHALFLGHSPRSVADRHYVKTSETVLDDALDWLGQQYGAEVMGQVLCREAHH